MTELGEKKSEGMLAAPSVWIGKSGLTESVVGEIKKQLKRKSIVKVKMLRPFVKEIGKKDDAANKIADATGSRIIQKVGFIVVLARKEEKA